MAKKTKAEIAVLAGLTLVAIGSWSYFSRSGVSSAHTAAPAAARYKAMGVGNPQIHWDRLDEAQQTEYEATGRDIFTGGSLAPTPLPIAIPQPVNVVEQAPPPPPPPSLSLKYFGYGASENDSGSRAFLTDGATVYIAAEGDTVLGHYRVLRISRSRLEFEDMSSGRRGFTAIEDQGPAF